MSACADAPARASVGSLVNGTASTEAGVVAVIHTRPTGTRQLCTGTLVGPNVVLTAKHCVYEDMGGSEWVANPTAAMSITLGDAVSSPTGEVAVTAISTTPGPYHDGDGANGGDIALLTLASVPPFITPRVIARDAPTAGLALRIEGFGYTGAGSTGTLGERHQGSAGIVSVAVGTFTSEGPSWTCTGDSGGPAFRASDGALLGVTSIGPRGCPASTSVYTRVDQHLALLAAAGVVIGIDVDAGADIDAGRVTDDAGRPEPSDAGLVAPPRRASGCSAGARGDERSEGLLALVALGLAVVAARRR